MRPTKEKTMEAIYLQSSLQFGETLKSVSDSDYRRLRDNYDALLKQPLQLGLFVPCDENGNVWEEPKRWNDYLHFPDSFDGNKEWGELYNYELAIERLLFKGFEFVKNINLSGLLPFSRFVKNDEYWNIQFLNRNIESLIIEFDDKIELTETAIKQIGL